MSRDVSWTDDEGITHHYPRAWDGHWFDAGRPSERACVEACKVVLEREAAERAEQETVKEGSAA